MLRIYTYWSAHYNEVIIIVAESPVEAENKLREVYMVGCEVDDWIINGSIPCTKNSSTSAHIIK